MENIPDQRNVAPPTATQPHFHASASARPGRFLILRRALRLLMRRFVYALARVGRVLRPYAAFLAIIVVLAGMVGVLMLALVWSTRTAPADTRVAAIMPAESVETYIKGQQDFNANLMWDAFSPNYQANQLSKGASKLTLQNQVDQERKVGIRYARYDYVGGVPISSGGNMYFYSVQYEVGSTHVEVPATYIVDTEGKIRAIITVSATDLLSK